MSVHPVLAVSSRRLLFALGILVPLVLSGGTSQAASTTFTVNSSDDVNDGTCDATHCSLREAINAANVNPGTDTIAFDISGAGPHTIQPTSALPTITDPVVIDGYTQPGASPNTNGPGLGSNAVLKIELDGSNTLDIIGLLIRAGNSTVRGLVINRFSAGIRLEANGGNVVEGNLIGTDVTGTFPLGNAFYGVDIHVDGSNNTIGGTTAAARNIISANGTGVRITGAGSTGNLVQGNFIGTDITGTEALGNGFGVDIPGDASNNLVGGTTSEARNIISGNTGGIGIRINSFSTENLVQGNFIGTDVTGNSAVPNGAGIVIAAAQNNIIGGATTEAGNVISGNGLGIFIISFAKASAANRVENNYIGTKANGTEALGNFDDGIFIAGGNNNTVIGNVISGNGSSGVVIGGSDAIENLVERNYIGTDDSGTIPLGNGDFGVKIDNGASNNTVGGNDISRGNIIAFNSPAGVGIHSPSTGNAILSNSIFSNTGLGIDLAPFIGVTPNDAGDGDSGANNLQNFPVLTLAASGSTAIEGTLNSTPNTEFRIEFFSTSACDPSGYGEGENFLGSTMVTTGGGGNASFSVTFPDTVPVGQWITATATDPGNNTSEFSQCIQVTQPPPDEQININVVDKLSGAKLEGTCWRISYKLAIPTPTHTPTPTGTPTPTPTATALTSLFFATDSATEEHDVVGDDDGGVKPDCGEPSNLKLFDKDPSPGNLRVTITSAQRVQFGSIWHVQMSFEPGGQLDTFNYVCDLSLGKCTIGPVAVGGLAVDLDEGPLSAAQPSGDSAERLASTVAGVAAVAVALSGAAWYARRRLHSPTAP